MPPKVDIHTHILPESWPDLKQRYGYGGWIRMEKSSSTSRQAQMVTDEGKFFRTVDTNCWNIEDRLREMDATGVDIQVLSTVPVMFSYWAKGEDAQDLCQLLNDHLCSCVRKYPNRFRAMCSVPLQSPDLAREELRRCAVDLGIKTVQIGSHVNDWTLNDKNLFPFYKTAEDLGVSVFVHPWDMATDGRWRKYWLPWLVGMPAETTASIVSVMFGGVLETFPSLKMCFAHGAGALPYTLGRIRHGFQVRPDLCSVDNPHGPDNYVNKIYADSLVHDPASLKLLLDTLGQDKVMLGSDYPFPLGEDCPGALVNSCSFLDTDTKEKILGLNALDFLGSQK